MNQPINHVQPFKAFVAAQDPQRDINHTEGWSSCAVGEYADSVGVHTTDVVVDIQNASESVYEVLNNGGGRHLLNRELVEPVDIRTYGKLSEFLNGVSVVGAEHSVSV